MSSNRLMYDTCEYQTKLQESAGTLEYTLNSMRNENCNKCRMELGTVGGANVSHIKGNLVDLETDVTDGFGVVLMIDPMGTAGRAFGVGRGWKPDDEDMSPYVKLFGMLFGLGVSTRVYVPIFSLSNSSVLNKSLLTAFSWYLFKILVLIISP